MANLKLHTCLICVLLLGFTLSLAASPKYNAGRHDRSWLASTQYVSSTVTRDRISSPKSSRTKITNIGQLANWVAQSEACPVIIIAQRPIAFKRILTANAFLVNDTSNLRNTLRSIGAIQIKYENPKCICIMQGANYGGPKHCSNTRIWQAFNDNVRKMSESEQMQLLTPHGILITSQDHISTGLKNLLMPTNFLPVSSTGQQRIKLTLYPVLFTGFPNAPTGTILGPWVWKGSGNESIQLPEEVNVSTNYKGSWQTKHINLVNGINSLSAITEKLSNSLSCEVKTSKNISWPDIYISGKDMPIGDFITSLKIACVAETRYFSSPHLLYLTKPSKTLSYVGDSCIPTDDQQRYNTYLDATWRVTGSEIEPLKDGIFQLPTSALPPIWVGTVLSGTPPEGAIESVGNPDKTLSTSLQHPKAVTSWLGVYATSSIVSNPMFAWNAVLQRQDPINPKYWMPIESYSDMVPAVCY
jgi:hypothetical protein